MFAVHPKHGVVTPRLTTAAELKLGQPEFGQRRVTVALKAARERAGLSQQQVAAAVGAYASFVSKVESGEQRVDVVELAMLCWSYGLTVGELLKAARIG